MKAVVLKKGRVEVEEVDDPRISNPTDALIRITSTGICGSDLHTLEGRTPAQPGIVMGHENMGVVVEIGEAVKSIRVGDRVVLPFNVACGFCFNCTQGWTHACLTMNEKEPHAAFGYPGMGPYRGGQAELLLAPYADFNCLKLPGEPGDKFEDDFVLLSDVFPTGYHGAVLANVQPGSSVAVFGAGPVGLLAAYSALLRGAAQVYVVDNIPERLEKARELGAIPVNFGDGDPVEQIQALRKEDKLIQGALRPGEEKLTGVSCGIDAVGYQARKIDDPGEENPTQVLEDLVRLVNPCGFLGVVGVYIAPDPGGVNRAAKKGEYLLPWAAAFDKGITIGTGQCPVKRYNVQLRDLIIAGRAKPSAIVSHRLPLEDAPGAYKKFDKREDGYTKVILKPELHVSTRRPRVEA